MTKEIKRIGVLTSGGDCAGLNAALYAVVHAAHAKGWEVYGIRNGSHGFMARPVAAQRLDARDWTADAARRGGTLLGTINKGTPFDFVMEDGSRKDVSTMIVEGIHQLKLDALIGIGGDGSLAILHKITQQAAIPFVAIPKTMDRDVSQTDTCIGYDTALGIATEALDRLQHTGESHGRVMVLEVMGRDAGHVALEAGIAGNADIILIPEIKWSMGSIQRKLECVFEDGRESALVIVSEAVKTLEGANPQKDFSGGQRRYGGIGEYVAEQISAATGIETRFTVLGHVQRGAPPTHTDRILGKVFGVHAVNLVAAGKFNRMVTWQGNSVGDVPLTDAIAANNVVKPDGVMVKTARALGVCLGD